MCDRLSAASVRIEEQLTHIGTIKGKFGVSFTIPSKVTGRSKEEY